MSRPPVDAEKTPAGIAVDPITLERVIPESRRADGSVRKEIKIRPGFTPQEDVLRFRGTRQRNMDQNALPKGHIIGWAPPPTVASPKPGVIGESSSTSDAKKTKSSKKNEKRKEKRVKKRVEEVAVPDNWEDDDEQEAINETAKDPEDSLAPRQASEEDTLSSKLGELEI